MLKDKFFVFLQLAERIEYYACGMLCKLFNVLFSVGRCCNNNFPAKLFIAKPCLVWRACACAIQIFSYQRKCAESRVGLQGKKDFCAGALLYNVKNLQVLFQQGFV